MSDLTIDQRVERLERALAQLAEKIYGVSRTDQIFVAGRDMGAIVQEYRDAIAERTNQ